MTDRNYALPRSSALSRHLARGAIRHAGASPPGAARACLNSGGCPYVVCHSPMRRLSEKRLFACSGRDGHLPGSPVAVGRALAEHRQDDVAAPPCEADHGGVVLLPPRPACGVEGPRRRVSQRGEGGEEHRVGGCRAGCGSRRAGWSPTAGPPGRAPRSWPAGSRRRRRRRRRSQRRSASPARAGADARQRPQDASEKGARANSQPEMIARILHRPPCRLSSCRLRVLA